MLSRNGPVGFMGQPGSANECSPNSFGLLFLFLQVSRIGIGIVEAKAFGIFLLLLLPKREFSSSGGFC